jgi:tRNA A-37 threonylcarbamoyl transferase component Bud32
MANRSDGERAGARPRFLYLALVVGILTLAGLTTEGIHAIQYGGYSRVHGAVEYDQTYIGWVASYLLVAASFYLVGMTMVLARPQDRTVQWGFATSLLVATFLVWVATRPVDGIHHDLLAAMLGLSFPLDLIAALLFLDRFPQPVDAGRRWRLAIRGVIAFASVLWVARAWLALVRALPDSGALAAIDRTVPVARAYAAVAPTLESACAAGMLGLLLAVLVRNYRLLPGPGERRRIQLVLWSHAIAVLPAVGVSMLSAMLQSGPALLRLTLAVNLLFIASPASIGYAIVKHRVLGFKVFVRLGIQYALAQNVLRAAVALPAALIVYGVVSNPNRTVGEIFAGSARLYIVLMGVAAAVLRFRAPLSAAIDRRFFRTAYDQEIILLRLIESIKQLDSLSEISAMVSREIDAALHVTRLVVLFRSPRDHTLSVGWSSGDLGPVEIPAIAGLVEQMARAPALESRSDVESRCSAEELVWLERRQIELLAPITGIDRTLCGLLLIGEKRSEEPFTSKDRNLLQMVASQVGAVYEVLALREQVGEHHRIQKDVLGRLERQQINLVRECPACGRCYDSTAERCGADGQALVLSLPVDRTLEGKYRLERLIGRGGMGAVYEATDLRLNRRVAAKVVRTAALASGAAQRRFAREAQACGRLEHPNIVRVYDFGMAGETAFLVMEYVMGTTWRAQLDRTGPFPSAAAAAALDQVMDGMEAAHGAGILHRDLKPENLLISGPLTATASVKILDFGLAKVREADFLDPKSMTMTGIAMGTFGYMSPEQLSGEDVDERTDVYAIGVIALETLTGRLPIEGVGFHRTIELELRTRLRDAAVTPPQRRLAGIIGRALAQNRVARIASVAELRANLVPAILECPAMPIGLVNRPTPAPDAKTAALTGDGPPVEATDAPTKLPSESR